ncbi:hypothetical protein HNQ69_000300 [Bartonella callosciuri]|uniref:Uncharacterized protein n=1 Tax=Bartonella callosciuri TaxID=686223 RepID=A0A840NKP8_9HYPH|nr:hypothetical protein [Bartonella callosciuri]
MICLGNSISSSNPYFDFFDPKNHQSDEFTHYKSKSILIGHTVGKEFIQEKLTTRFAQSIKDTTYSSLIFSKNVIKDDFAFINKMKSIRKKHRLI